MADLRAFAGDYALFRAAVMNGRDVMPGFAGVLSEDELTALYAFVKSGGAPEDE